MKHPAHFGHAAASSPTSPGGFPVWFYPLIGTIGVVIALQILFFLAQALYDRIRGESVLKKFRGPPAHWFWGTLEKVGSTDDHMDVWMRWQRDYGTIIKLRLGFSSHQVDVSDPESIQIVMASNEPKSDVDFDAFRPWLGESSLSGHGPPWVRIRKLLTPGFKDEMLKAHLTIFNNSVQTLILHLRELLVTNPRIEISERIAGLAYENMLKCTFGYQGDDIQTLEKDKKIQYLEWTSEMLDIVYNKYRNPVAGFNEFVFEYLTGDGWRARHLSTTIHDFSMDFIKYRRKMKSTSDRKYLDFLGVLLNAKDDEGSRLTDNEIRAETDMFMFIGLYTTSSVLSFFLYNMATNPEIQQRCYKEITEVMGDQNEITWETVQEFQYLTQCLKETMRMYTPLPYSSRRPTRDIRLRHGAVVPKGVWLRMNLSALHYNPDVWPNPDKYDPERFSPENEKLRHNYAFVPFSGGQRNCIGQNFAWLQLKTTAAMLLRSFEVEYNETEPPSLNHKVVVSVKGDLWITFKHRKWN